MAPRLGRVRRRAPASRHAATWRRSFTALTYQALATFEDHDTVDGPRTADGPSEPAGRRLHPNGRALVERLQAVGDLTLVLDECHHLVEVWGRLLAELLDELPDAFVLGLTATPPSTLTRTRSGSSTSCSATPLFSVEHPGRGPRGRPGPVRRAGLADHADADGVGLAGRAGRAVRRADHGAERPGVRLDAASSPGSTARFLTGLPTEPARARRGAADGARRAARPARRRHGSPSSTGTTPTADDWVLLIERLGAHLLDRTGARRRRSCERVRAVLPSVGYQLTRRGIRRGRSPVDRVLARSEAKTVALAQIVQAEHRNLGDRLRMLVLCDHERATATLPADLDGVRRRAGRLGARWRSSTSSDARARPAPAAGHRSTVAGVDGDPARRSRRTSRRTTRTWPSSTAGSQGRWTSRDWVPWVTRFFEEGHCQVLVGTRGLLGEGWDARSITGLVDLTTATTSTAVVQTRGPGAAHRPVAGRRRSR